MNPQDLWALSATQREQIVRQHERHHPHDPATRLSYQQLPMSYQQLPMSYQQLHNYTPQED